MPELGFKDIIDIFLVACLLHYCYRLMKQSRSLNIFYGILLFISFWIVVGQVLHMKMLGGILSKFSEVGTIAVVILFQDDIKQFFSRLGAREQGQRFLRFLKNDHTKTNMEFRHDRKTVLPIVMACMNMGKQKVGALIVMENDVTLKDTIESGELINAKISQRLIENIFFKNSPLHDGAMIISGDQITAAACILPVSHDLDIPKEFGLRHRAAKGISETTDALAIIVSEETGSISAAYNNQLRAHLTAEDLELLLLKGRF